MVNLINKSIFNGRLVKDPVFKKLPEDNAVVSFSVAVKRSYKNNNQEYDADFIPCIAWGNKAKLYADRLKKGMLVGISGSLRSRTYEDGETGKKHGVLEVLVEELDFLEPKSQQKNDVDFKLSEDPLS
ncbi:single-stranded DNA-binding protein [Cytobacillus gottheilii]|uniref:single-stranded DNA-binding protein n=1 Tax=Cytobacillus gottheilii TaxID=859144 RepID=UPI00248475E5|nr:single-stranded DNA-binding protein [Cytobacillus gottheilii]